MVAGPRFELGMHLAYETGVVTNPTRVILGSPTWARTTDLVINSHALYQLSYRRIILVRLEEIESPTPCFVGKCSIHLSYSRVI